MQALMKQAQAMQRDMNNIKNEIDNSVKGTKEVVKVTFDEGVKDLINDDISMVEDMIMVALNDAFSKVDKVTLEKMGKFANMMPGLM